MSWLSSRDCLWVGMDSAFSVFLTHFSVRCSFCHHFCGLVALKKKLSPLVLSLPVSWFHPWVSRQLVTYGAGFGKINHKLIWKLKQVLCDCGIAHSNKLITRFWLLRCIASTRTCTRVNAACEVHLYVPSAHIGHPLQLWVTYSSNCNLYKTYVTTVHCSWYWIKETNPNYHTWLHLDIFKPLQWYKMVPFCQFV